MIMTDKEKIRAEIERRLAGNNLYVYSRTEYADLLSFIDSMQEEPVSEIDFEQELYKYFGQVKDFTLGMRIAKRFYEIGRNYLMKDAIDTVVKVDAGGYPYVDRTIELYDYDKDIPLAKKGDKVKIVVIKED